MSRKLPAPRINTYTCEDCGHRIVTIEEVEGVTPMFLPCLRPGGCTGRARSAWYRVPPGLVPEWEWYRPSGVEIARMDPAARDHARQGGLELRKLTSPKTGVSEV